MAQPTTENEAPKHFVKISIVIPVVNEIDILAQCVERAWSVGDEVIVVDGGSTDGSVERAQSLPCQFVESELGRGQQLNAGSQFATGDVLLFLHADTWLPADAKSQLIDAFVGLASDGEVQARFYGCFKQRIDDEGWVYRWIEKGNFHRARWQRLIYGDQGLFVSRKLFDAVGGFPDISLMEDFEISRNLRRAASPTFLDGPIQVASRRWQKNGPIRLTIRNWMFAMGYRLGVSPQRLARLYK